MQVQLQTQLLLVAVESAETGQRGYLLTGEFAYLEPYREGASIAQARVDALAAMTRDNPGQQTRVERVEGLMRTRLAQMAEVLERAERGQRGVAIAILRGGHGRETMAQFREALDQVWRAETQLLRAARRAASVRAAADERRWALILTGFALLLLVGLTASAVSAVRAGREARARKSEIEVAHRVQVELEARIVEAQERWRASEAALRQSQKMEAIGQLAGGIAHDFNNMLAIVMGSLEMAQRRLAAGDQNVERFIVNAMDGARRAATLTQRILAFSRQQPLEPKTIQPNRLVSDMSELLRRTLGEQIRFETVLAGGAWSARVDAHQLENVILNLAVNARDAMPEGGALTIETGNAYLDEAYAAQNAEVSPGQYVYVAVSDTGSGMSQAVIDKAFEPFFTTKGVGKGTGLGLSQAFGFVKQSGGHIKIYSEIGQGTSVKVYLPRWMGEDAKVEAVASAPETLQRGAPEEIVLVVEDDERVRLVSVATLRDLGYTVRHARSGADALEILEANPGIALLFTDIVMPDMNGRQLAEQALSRWPRLKVLYTTGYTRNAIVHNGVLDAGVAFIAKPFTALALAAKVRGVLDS